MSDTPHPTVRLTLDAVRDLATRCLAAHGADEVNAAAIADTITRAERDGAHSHGLFRLPGYVAALDSGKVNGKARPRVEDLAPSVVRVHGDDGFAPLALATGRAPLAERARFQGLAALALTHTHHFAALWAEVEPLAEDGLCAFAFTAFKPSVVAAGGRTPIFGTNPMAFGWPRPGRDPMVFDQATAAMARGEVSIAARDGRTLPDGVGIDADGKPTNDPNEVLKGALLPFGGYKGSALAMMIELLVAGLIGERFSFEAAAADNNDGGPPRGGELMLAIDPARFGDAEGWAAHSEAFFDRLLADEGVRLPGDRRRRNRAKSLVEGVEVQAELHAKLESLAG
jgi:delta1-piperideine-2-carboxylate reductase